MVGNSLTTTPPLPDAVIKWGKCLLLHQKTPIILNGEIKWICKECYNDNDTPKDQEASQAT